jgi:ribose transport system permease protein
LALGQLALGQPMLDEEETMQAKPVVSRGPRVNLKTVMQLSLVILLVLLWSTLSVTTSSFATTENILNLLRQTAIGAILAIGQTFVIITGGIDLSVGSVIAVVGVSFALMVTHGVPLAVALLLSLGIGLIVGLINGFAIHRLGLPPFIATLAMLGIGRGAALLLTGGSSISGLPDAFTNFSTGSVLGLPNLFWMMIGIAAIAWVLLHRSKWGRYLFAYGSNKEAARLSGIHNGRVIFLAYGVSGLCAGVAGLLLASRIGVGIPTAGQGYELDSIAASVIGGASLFGAEGGIIGTLLGALLITTIGNGANLLNVDPFWQQVITGLLIAVIVYIDQLRKRGEG